MTLGFTTSDHRDTFIWERLQEQLCIASRTPAVPYMDRTHVTRLLRGPEMCSQMAVSVGLVKIFHRLTHCWRWPEFIQYHRSPEFPMSADTVPFRAPVGIVWVKCWHVRILFTIDKAVEQPDARYPDTLKNANVTSAGAGTS